MDDDEVPDINAILEHLGATTRDRRSYMTHCVFHEDRRPSMSINTEKGVWKCQSCGRSGGALALLMQKEDISFGEARDLATSLGVATGSSGGGGGELRGGSYAGYRQSAARKGDRQKHRPYVPRWRRS